MILAFLLVVTVAGEKVSEDSMLFKNIYRCNAFAIAIESGKKSPHDSRRNPQQNIIAYCMPKMVNTNSDFWD
jgi:hypothetical protein